MKINETEKIIKMVQMNIDLDHEEYKALYAYGLKLIKEDKEEVINYAINRILKDMITDLESPDSKFKKIIEKEKKNGKSNS